MASVDAPIGGTAARSGGRSRASGPLVIAAAAVAVVVVAALLGRGYLANDDDILVEFFRADAEAPFVAAALSRAMRAAYAAAPALPWFGLWLYAVHALAFGVTAGALVDLPAGTPRPLARATWIGAGIALAASAALALRPTYGNTAIAGCCAGLVALASELTRPGGARTGRALWAGLAVAAGLATRLEAIAASVAATAPLFAAIGWRMLRARRFVRPGPVLALLGPAVVVLAVGALLPTDEDAIAQRYRAFNAARHALHFQGAYVDLDRRAPELLARAGWTSERYWRFTNRFYFVDDWYTPERLRRLHDTGGAPRPVWTILPTHLRDAQRSAGYGATLLAAVAVAAIALALLGPIQRSAAALAVGHLGWLLVVAIALQRWMHFPDRIAVPMAIGAACAALIALRRGVVTPAWATAIPWRRPGPALALVAAAALTLATAVRVEDFRTVRTDVPPCAELERRIADRRPALVVSYLEPSCLGQPLRAAPRPYPSVTLTWPIFSPPFYRGLARLDVRDARDLVAALAAHRDAFVLVRRRYLDQVIRGFSTPGTRVTLSEVDATGPGATDLVLARVERHEDPAASGTPG